MTEQQFVPLDALQVLVTHGVRFVLIGGFAASIRGSPMLTDDLDICYARDKENLERLAEALRGLKATLRGAPEGIPFLLDARTLEAGDHFTFSTSFGALDCLGTPAGTRGFADLDADATDEDLDGVSIRVASVDGLIRMKRAVQRPKDRIALEWLAALREELERGGRDSQDS